MWISKYQYRRIIERLERLESRAVSDTSFVSVSGDGLLDPWQRGPHIAHAINALAKHLNFKWQFVPATGASITGAAQGKPGEQS